MSDYFKEDKYWKKHINNKLEEDMWLENYKDYFPSHGICLDLGCGRGEYSKKFIEYGYKVISTDISNLALEEVKKFNSNIKKLDMREKLPFEDAKFDIVFANLSIHYFNDKETKNLLNEIYRVLKKDALFIGSVNSIKLLNNIKYKMKEIENNFYYNNEKYMRFFDEKSVRYYLKKFNILKIEEKETKRFEYKKDYIIFISKK